MVKDQLTNFYQKIPKDLIPKYHNPSYKNHLINIPARILVVGGSGSGKTTLVLEMISRMKKTFERIVLCCKSVDEPLYKYLCSKLKKGQIEVYEDGVIPPIDNYKGLDEQLLFIFDDLVNMKDQQPIIEFFIRGRKLAKGITMMYLTQSYYKTPKTIRLQANYIFLKKLSSMRDLNNILEDFNLGIDKKALLKVYKEATHDRQDFLMVDIDAQAEQRFRTNFLNVFDLSKFLPQDKPT